MMTVTWSKSGAKAGRSSSWDQVIQPSCSFYGAEYFAIALIVGKIERVITFNHKVQGYDTL